MSIQNPKEPCRQTKGTRDEIGSEDALATEVACMHHLLKTAWLSTLGDTTEAIKADPRSLYLRSNKCSSGLKSWRPEGREKT